MGIGLRVVLGLAVCGLALAAIVGEHAMTVLAWSLGVLMLTWIAMHYWVHRPMDEIGRVVRAIARRDADVELPQLGRDWVAITESLRAAVESRASDERELASEHAARLQVEARLKETEERYALAIRGASDGLWEWNLRSGTMHLSPRWKHMLGFQDQEIPETPEGWKDRLHADDRPIVESRLAAHLSGATERFESEHRVVHRDGSHRWMLSRGAAIRHANGEPYRFIGMDSDVSHFKRLEDVMLHVAEGTSAAIGTDFFRSLVRHFALALGVRTAFVTECVDHPATRVRALAWWEDERFVDGVEYALAGAPCEGVIAGAKPAFHPMDVERLFPREQGLGYESYLGLPIFDAANRVIGHLGFFDRKKMGNEMLLNPVFRIFTARAAAELARLRVERAVVSLADRLYPMSGDEACRLLVEQFAQLIGAREAFVCECLDDPPTRVRMLAHWNKGGHVAAVEFALQGTTCEEVIHTGQSLFVSRGVGERWPRERDYDRDSYLGLACLDASGAVIGHIACMDGEPLAGPLPDQAVLKLFAVRAGVELERRRSRDRQASAAR